jgi:Uma2 family endonuclease
MRSSTSLMTFEEFERLPDEPGKFELLDGELIQMPPAKSKHGKIAKRVYTVLNDAVNRLHSAGKALELGEAFFEMGYRLGSRTWLQPDVSILHASQKEQEYFEEAPALAVEIISESNTARQMDRKVRRYLASGGQEVWLIYPDTRSVWIHQAGSSAALSRCGRFSSTLLPGEEFDLEQILSGLGVG